ncbi:MAG: LysM peptidoglycan-binding domain-containing protein [Victivallales bacterium]
MNRRIFVAGTASLLSFVLCSCGIFESGSDVPPPPQGEEWSAKIKSSYPDWQPPREMPEGSAEYRAALKDEQELKALESKDKAEVKAEKSVCPDDAAQKEVKAEPEIPTSYIVRKNDNLWNIAKAIYGKGEKWTVIFEANKEKIKDPNKLKPGLELLIPPAGK